MKIFENITSGYKKIATGIAIVMFLTVMYIALIPGAIVAAESFVLTASGDPIVGAFVKLTDYPQYNATTDVNGNYTMPNVPIGTYTISASAPGYATNTSTVTVLEGATVTKDFILSVGYEIFVPWTATTGGWTTPYSIVNMGTANATVLIDYYDANTGNLVANDNVTILPGAVKFAFREWKATGTDGSAVLLSDQPISVVVNSIGSGDKIAQYIAEELDIKPSGPYEVFIPWTATTGGWTTPYQIVNMGEANATVAIDYYDANTGNWVNNDSATILPGAVKFIFREWKAAGTDGSAKLVSDQPISVVVNSLGSGDKIGQYTAQELNSSFTAPHKIYVPWTATTGGWTTPYQIVNAGTANATVAIDYYDANTGNWVNNDSVTVLPGAVKFVFREWKASGTDGSAVLTSDQPISVVVNSIGSGNKIEQYTAKEQYYPPVGPYQIYVPWTATTGGWTTPYQIVNMGSANATVAIDYYDANTGNWVNNDSTTILPGAVKFIFREWKATGTDGSAVLTSDQPISGVVNSIGSGDKIAQYEIYMKIK